MRAGLLFTLILATMSLSCHKQKATQAELIWAGAIPDVSVDITQTQPVQPSTSNYPNPFSPPPGISYQITKDSAFVRIVLFNISGKPIDTLINNWQPQGNYDMRFSLRGHDKAGVYFFQIAIDSITEMKKMVLFGKDYNNRASDSRFTVKIAEVYDTAAMHGEIFRTDTLYHPDAPNPFSPPSNIFFRYHIDTTQRVHLVVSDVTGTVVDTVMRIKQLPGYYRATLRPQNAESGVYFYTLSIGDWRTTNKFVLLK